MSLDERDEAIEFKVASRIPPIFTPASELEEIHKLLKGLKAWREAYDSVEFQLDTWGQTSEPVMLACMESADPWSLVLTPEQVLPIMQAGIDELYETLRLKGVDPDA